MLNLASDRSAHRLQVHGHRGCRGLFPENTLPAFLHALQLGVDILEMDVVISADQQVVVAHEPWLSARLGFSPDGRPIAPEHERDYNLYQLPYAAIRESKLGVLSHPLFPQQQLVATYRPLLSEAIHAIEIACKQLGRSPVGYSIEVKSNSSTDGLFHPVPDVFVELVLGAIPPVVFPRITLLSFDTRILQVARRYRPALRLCMLLEEPFTSASLFSNLTFVPEILGPDFLLLTPDLVQQLTICYPTLAIVPWTINEPMDLVAALNEQYDGITTDYPDRLINLRNKV